MIDIKPNEESSWDEFWKRVKDATDEDKAYVPINDSTAEVAKELHELNKTLKEILKEIRGGSQ